MLCSPRKEKGGGSPPHTPNQDMKIGSSSTRLAAFYFAYFCYLGAYAPYFSLYLAGEGFPPAEIATMLALPQFVRIFAPMAWGWLSDVTGSRRGVVALSCAMTTASVATLFFVTGFM